MQIFFEKFLWFMIYLFLSVVTSAVVYYGLIYLTYLIFNISLFNSESNIEYFVVAIISIPVSITWNRILYDKIY